MQAQTLAGAAFADRVEPKHILAQPAQPVFAEAGSSGPPEPRISS